jgi:hypothetical protein
MDEATRITLDRVAWMTTEPTWSPWQAAGWVLRPGQTAGTIMAVNGTLRQATLAAKRLDTIVKRLERQEWDYLRYVHYLRDSK